MTMRIYQSTDASAPTLQGVVGGAFSSGWSDGSLLQLLYKVLYAGYGSQTAAGWTVPYTGTSKGVFKQGGGCGFYFRVLDDGSLTAGAREAQFYGGVGASDVDTLTQQFPTSGQQSTYLKFRKSNAASSTQRNWLVMADNKTAIIFSWSNMGDGATDYLTAMYIGDFYSFHTSDAYNCCAIGRVTSATLDTSTNETLQIIGTANGIFAGRTGHYMAGGYNQVGTSVNFGKLAHQFISQSASSDAMGVTAGLAVPNPSDSRLYASRIYISDSTTVPTSSIRGYLRGLWNLQHIGSSLPREYAFTGVGNLAGKSIKVLGLPGGTTGSIYAVETSDTWD